VSFAIPHSLSDRERSTIVKASDFKPSATVMIELGNSGLSDTRWRYLIMDLSVSPKTGMSKPNSLESQVVTLPR